MATPAEHAIADDDTVEGSMIGRLIGKYEIVRLIGQGGMGSVYEALNTAIGKRVAMKFVDADLSSNKDMVARFQREAQAASAVESAHIVEIFDSGITDDGRPFIVMELLRGEDLGHRIKRCGRLEIDEAVHVTAQILRGLHRAHEAGIVHRDLKPDNIFLVDRDDDPNFAKIVDFGISKVQRSGDVPAHTLTRQGTVLGTPFYMSPEQAQASSDVDGRTDIWAVGAILYECLAGRPPHTGKTYEQVIVSICMKDVDDVRVHNPAVPEALALVIRTALQRDREERFATAREFLDALTVAAGTATSRWPASGREGRTVVAPAASATTPRPGDRTPAGRGRASEGGEGSATMNFGPTVEIDTKAPPGPASVRLGKRHVFGAAAGALLVGGALTFFLLTRGGEEASATPEAAPAGESAGPADGTAGAVTASVPAVEPVVAPLPSPEAAPEASSEVSPAASVEPAPSALASAAPSAEPRASAAPVVQAKPRPLPKPRPAPAPEATAEKPGGVAPQLGVQAR